MVGGAAVRPVSGAPGHAAHPGRRGRAAARRRPGRRRAPGLRTHGRPRGGAPSDAWRALSFNQATAQHWPLPELVAGCVAAGVRASACGGSRWPSTGWPARRSWSATPASPSRRCAGAGSSPPTTGAAENLRAIDEAAALGRPGAGAGLRWPAGRQPGPRRRPASGRRRDRRAGPARRGRRGTAGHRAAAPHVRRRPVRDRHARPGAGHRRAVRPGGGRRGRRRVPRLVGRHGVRADRAGRRPDRRVPGLRLGHPAAGGGAARSGAARRRAASSCAGCARRSTRPVTSARSRSRSSTREVWARPGAEVLDAAIAGYLRHVV